MSDRAASRGLSNVVKMVSGRLATHALLVVTTLLLPRLFGAEGYGHYAAVMAVLLMVQTLTRLGLPSIEARYLSPLWAARRFEEARTLASTTWTLLCATSLLSALIAALWLAGTRDLGLGPMLLLALAVTAALRGLFDGTRTLLLPVQRAGTMALLELLRAGVVLLAAVVGFRIAGLEGVYLTLPIVWLALTALAVSALRAVVAVSPRQARFASVAPHLSYGLLYWVGGLAAVVQSQFSVFALAVWAGRVEAGLLGLTIQVFLVAQTFFGTAQQAVNPLLAELESRAEGSRLDSWASVTMRYGAALTTLLALGWSLLGGELLRSFLGAEFLPVHRSASIILVGAAFFCCAASASSLLGVRERPGLKSLCEIVYAVVTIVGLWWVLATGAASVLDAVSWVHTGAAVVYFGLAWLVLGRATGSWLPLSRSLLLLAPLAFVFPVLGWQAGLAARLGVAVSVPLLYGLYAVALRLLPRSELSRLLRLGTSR